jgi:hypothetical protein
VLKTCVEWACAAVLVLGSIVQLLIVALVLRLQRRA